VLASWTDALCANDSRGAAAYIQCPASRWLDLITA